jgi:large subunit ribosomal protein L25
MPEIKLVAETRTQFGKGRRGRIRRDHKIPAVLYGHGPPPSTSPCRDTTR